MNEIIEQRRGGAIRIVKAQYDNTYNVEVDVEDDTKIGGFVMVCLGNFTLTDASTLADLMVKAPIIEVAR